MATRRPEARPLTTGPEFHWFGYYDKLEIDPTNRFVLGMQVGFENRSPTADDVIGIGMVDLEDGNRWIDLGQSKAWGWQQGCMLQWRPGSTSEILWNDRENDRFVTRLLDVHTGERCTLPMPVYALSPDGSEAVTTDFRRINHTRPGYGYAGIPDPNHDNLAPDDVGLWRMDLNSGQCDLIISVADIVKIPWAHTDVTRGVNYFNHLLYNTDGMRFEFLHRCIGGGGESGLPTRMMTAALDGSDIRVIDDRGHMSHFIWRDPESLLAWTRLPSHGHAFYVLGDGDGRVEVVGEGDMVENGHCLYLPGNEWILNDTYPGVDDRLQNLYVYHVASGRKVSLGDYLAPPGYDGEWRCDLHARFSPDGRMIVFDSAHAGNGRQLYRIDIGDILDAH